MSPRIQVMLGPGRARRDDGDALRRPKRCSSRTTSSSRSPRATTSSSGTTSPIPYLVVTGHRYPAPGISPRRARRAPPLLRAVSRTPARCARAYSSCRRCSASAPARTPSSRNRSRPCLLHQIRRCTAPCVGLVERRGLRGGRARAPSCSCPGKEDEVMERLAARMAERRGAHGVRGGRRSTATRSRRCARCVEKQFVSGQGGDADVIACGRAAGVACVNLVMIRGGHHLGDRNFFPRNADDAAPEQVLEAFLAAALPAARHPVADRRRRAARRARRSRSCSPSARDAPVQHRDPTRPARAARGSRWRGRTRSSAPSRSSRSQATQETRLAALQQALELPDTAQRIECFDVSHTMGEATVASCVVYDRSAMQKGEYRRYNIAASVGREAPSLPAPSADSCANEPAHAVGPELPAPAYRRRHRAGRRLRGDARSADAALPQGRGGGGQGAGPRADRRRQGPARRGARGVRRDRPDRRRRRRGRQGRGAQAGAGAAVAAGRAASPLQLAAGPSRAASHTADPRRSAPLRDPGASRAPRQGALDLDRWKRSRESARSAARSCSRASAGCAACSPRASTTSRRSTASAARSRRRSTQDDTAAEADRR